MRPGEALVLRVGDLKPHPFDAVLDESIVEVNVPPSITKREFAYTTFAHPECVKLLAEFLRAREARGFNVEDPSFPLFYNLRSQSGGFYKVNSLEVAWNRLLSELKLDEKIRYGGRSIHVRRLYTLRKFFRTNLESAGVPYGAVEALLGHKQWYVRFSKEKLREYYKRGMWALMVLSVPSEEQIRRIVEEEVHILRREIEVLKREREKELIARERRARELAEALYRILKRHPEILRELERGF